MPTLRCFVDAGYFFSAGSDVLAGRVVPRRDIELDRPADFIENLLGATQALWDGEPLRLLEPIGTTVRSTEYLPNRRSRSVTYHASNCDSAASVPAGRRASTV